MRHVKAFFFLFFFGFRFGWEIVKVNHFFVLFCFWRGGGGLGCWVSLLVGRVTISLTIRAWLKKD